MGDLQGVEGAGEAKGGFGVIHRGREVVMGFKGDGQALRGGNLHRLALQRGHVGVGNGAQGQPKLGLPRRDAEGGFSEPCMGHRDQPVAGPQGAGRGEMGEGFDELGQGERGRGSGLGLARVGGLAVQGDLQTLGGTIHGAGFQQARAKSQPRQVVNGKGPIGLDGRIGRIGGDGGGA